MPVVSFEDVDRIYFPVEYDMLVVCGYFVMRNRQKMYEKAKKKTSGIKSYFWAVP